MEHHWHFFHSELLNEGSAFWVVVLKHPFSDFWEDVDKWLSLDFGAFSDPGNKSTLGFLVKFLTLSKDWEELLVPVVGVDFVSGSLPSGNNVIHSFLVGSICSFKFCRVSLSLVVIEINVPFWDIKWTRFSSTAGAAHIASTEIWGII